MDLKQWENMWAFYSLPTTWPASSQISDSMLTGKSVLRWMMLLPSLDTAWCPTYAWNAELECSQWIVHSTTTPICTTNQLPCISLTMWNYWQGSKLKKLSHCTAPWTCTCRQQEKLTQLPPQPLRETLQSVTAGPNT